MTAIIPSLVSCTAQPEAIVFGKDNCHFCKMTIVDQKFGAELVTTKGKVYKFDDVKCLLAYDQKEQEAEDTYKYKLVVDFQGQGNLIEVKDALFLTSPEIRSPMNGQVAAFQSESAMEEANKQWDGTYVSWDELTAQSR
jgi:copper chaperone NosL